jgi:hypothetical protein
MNITIRSAGSGKKSVQKADSILKIQTHGSRRGFFLWLSRFRVGCKFGRTKYTLILPNSGQKSFLPWVISYPSQN